ncbi:hypothetical protein DNTS_017617, partial [Danionella cerebrum]
SFPYPIPPLPRGPPRPPLSNPPAPRFPKADPRPLPPRLVRVTISNDHSFHLTDHLKLVGAMEQVTSHKQTIHRKCVQMLPSECPLAKAKL